MASTLLISTAELAAVLGDPHLRIIDCRSDLTNLAAGELAYTAGHIPGARHVHLDRELSDLSLKSVHGRHPLPSAEQLARVWARLDIDQHSRVVAYDQDQGMYAARLWWMLRETGHTQVQILDGGYAKWQTDGQAIETTTNAGATELPREGAGQLRAAAIVPVAQLQQALADETILLLDARGAPRFRGEVEPIDPVAGHVPGASNRPYPSNLDADGRFKPADVLRAEFAALLVGRSPASVVHMCGSGVTACHNLFAMELAGLTGSRLYADSWSGWITDPARPIARGP